MRQFCKEVIDFLLSEYGDGYDFHIESCIIPSSLGSEEPTKKVELWVKFNTHYSVKIVDTSMRYLYKLWINKQFIPERKQYLWQKELIDLIEGS